MSVPPEAVRKVIRPREIDGTVRPSMLDLEAAVRRAVLVGDVRRERVYRLARAVRLRRAWREAKR